jgi:hypothetical protein
MKTNLEPSAVELAARHLADQLGDRPSKQKELEELFIEFAEAIRESDNTKSKEPKDNWDDGYVAGFDRAMNCIIEKMNRPDANSITQWEPFINESQVKRIAAWAKR